MVTQDVSDRPWWSSDTVAVVTGSNRGLGFGIVCEFARRGITVVLTARDCEKGSAAVKSARLKFLESKPGAECQIHFHQLDITDAQSVGELAAWLQSKFGGIDILVNNAAINKYSNTFDDAVATLETNYFGVRRVTEALLPLLKPSPHGARIVNISYRAGRIQAFKENDNRLKGQIEQAVANLDMNAVDSLAAEYLEDERSGRLKEKYATDHIYQYRHSNLFMNTFTGILTGELSKRPDGQKIFVNAMCPGGVDTDMARDLFEKLGEVGRQWLQRAGITFASVEEGGKGPVWLALLPEDKYPHGKFFVEREESSF